MKNIFCGISIKCVSLCLFCFLSFSALTQNHNLEWAFGMGLCQPHRLATDDSGNVYTTGRFSGTFDFDPGPGTYNLTAFSGFDMFVMKHDATGKFKWAKMFIANGDIKGNSIAIDPSGYIYITGVFAGTATFSQSPSVSYTGLGGSDIFVLKLGSNNGAFQWAKRLGGNFDDVPNGIDLTPQGDVIIAGWFQGTADFDPNSGTKNLSSASISIDAFYCKLDASGNYVWAKKIGGSTDDICKGVDVDAKGKIHIVGFFTGSSIDFEPDPNNNISLNSAGGKQAFIAKYDSAGFCMWARNPGGTADDEALAVKVDEYGNVYSTGYFEGTSIDFETIPTGGIVYNLSSHNNSQDAFICKMDIAGSVDWARAIGGIDDLDFGTSIDVDNSGNVYTAGCFMKNVDFDPGSDSFNITAVYMGGGGNPDIFISKLDYLGDFVWAGSMGGGAYDQTWSIDLDSSANTYITGIFLDSADIDPTPKRYVIPNTYGFLAKLGNCSVPVISGSVTGYTSICAQSNNTYSITPVSGATSYEWTIPTGWTGSSNTSSINVKAGNGSGDITVKAVNDCGNSSILKISVTVKPLPAVTLNLSAIDTQCVQTGNVVLSGGSPAGGTYSGTGVSGGNFSPSTAGQGNFIITYTYTDANNCSGKADDNIYVMNCTDIKEISEYRLPLYPNPFQSTITVKCTTAETRIRLYSITGKQLEYRILPAGEHLIDLSHLSPGIYIVQLSDAYGTSTGKMIKEQ